MASMIPKIKPVPFDVKEITDVFAGVKNPSENDYVCPGFMCGRDVRRKALPVELPEDINGEPSESASFGNLRKIQF